MTKLATPQRFNFPGDARAAVGAVPLADRHGDRAGEERVGPAVGRPGQEEQRRAVEPAPGGDEGYEPEGDGAADEGVVYAEQGSVGEVPANEGEIWDKKGIYLFY